MRGEKGGLGRGEVKEYARVHATQVHIHVHGTVFVHGDEGRRPVQWQWLQAGLDRGTRITAHIDICALSSRGRKEPRELRM